MARFSVRKVRKLERVIKKLEEKAAAQESERMFYDELAEIAGKYVRMHEKGGINIDTSDKCKHFLAKSEKLHALRLQTLGQLAENKAKFSRLLCSR